MKTKFAEYAGEDKPSIDKVTLRVYQEDDAAYNDVLANSLDYTDIIPSDRLVGDLYKTELDNRYVERETGTIAVNAFSPIDKAFENEDLRRAISMAIDRDLINKQIFNGTRPPVQGWVSPVVDGFKADACGESCTYNPEKAKELYAKSGGYPGTLQLSVNGDGGHGPWAEAACNSIKNTLGLECVANITPDFKTIRDQIGKRGAQGHLPVRLGDGLPVVSRTSWPRSTAPAPARTTPGTATRSSTPSSSRPPPRRPPRRRTRCTRRRKPSWPRTSRPCRCGSTSTSPGTPTG